MNYRHAQILAAEDLTTAGTKVIDLNIADVISRIDLRWEVTKSKHSMDAGSPADITKIELVDGSDVLHSLSGYENQALCLYDRQIDAMTHAEHLNAVEQVTMFGIDFGRRLFDPDLAFDPTRFKNPQLKISWDEDVSDTGVTANYLEIWAHIFDEKIVRPVGFLMSKELYSYTCGADGSYEYVSLPTDYAIRQILVRAYRAAYEPWYQIDEARLDENNLKRIPFDYLDLEDYARMMQGIWHMIKEQFVCVADDAGAMTYYATPTDYWAQASLVAHTAGYVTQGTIGKGGKFTPIASTADIECGGVICGYLPWHCYQFPFGVQGDMADWYDVTKVPNPRLRLRAGGSGTSGTGAVVLQQLRKY